MSIELKGVLRQQEPLSSYTAWHIGGSAELYYKPSDVQDLSAFLTASIASALANSIWPRTRFVMFSVIELINPTMFLSCSI